MIIDADLITALQGYGYLGVFVASLMGSLVPFLPVPYLMIVVLLSNVLNPFLLGILAGIGGSLGKISSYVLGRTGYRFFSSATKQRVEYLKKAVNKYGDIAIFVFALTPLPDDVLVIPIGMMRFSFLRFILANTAGKILLSVAVAFFGRTYFSYAEPLLGGSQLLTILIAIAFMVVITILLLKVDWELAFNIAKERGIKGVLANARLILSSGKRKNE